MVPCFLDASVMVKLVVNEKDSGQVRNLFNNLQNLCFTTNFCFFESLSVLKRKWLNKEINRNEYVQFCRRLFAYKKARRIRIKEYPLEKRYHFRKLECLTEKYDIDISDALQLLSIKETILAKFAKESQTTLMTADEKLAESTKKEDVKVNYIS